VRRETGAAWKSSERERGGGNNTDGPSEDEKQKAMRTASGKFARRACPVKHAGARAGYRDSFNEINLPAFSTFL
jgi:hypothetical protein